MAEAPSLVVTKLTPLLALALFLLISINPADGQTGVCYGTLGNGLPSPQATVSLFRQKNIQRMRIYDPNPSILQALSGSGIQLMLGVPNSDLARLAASQSNAATWVQQNVRAYPTVRFRYIVVGNEIRPNNGASQYASSLLPALRNVQAAINQAGLGSQIKVSTAFDYGVIGVSYPPSAGKFDDSIRSFLDPIIQFVSSNGAPLMINVYPYFSYAGSSVIRLDYALFTARGTVVTDGGLGYRSLFDAMVDAAYSALERAGAGSVALVVSESGWPTAGGRDTNINNGRTYNNNLIRSVRGGTPKRPGKELETYIFAMYNENNKSPELEKHWGLFINTSPKYDITF
ncbi:hypothetical protein V2J09_023964 [Rumex salicifolius]